MKKSELVVGKSYFYKDSKYHKGREAILVNATPYGPAPDKWQSKTDVLVKMRNRKDTQWIETIVPCMTLKGDFQVLKAEENRIAAAEARERAETTERNRVAGLHLEQVFMPKFTVLQSLLESATGKQINVSIYNVTKTIPEEIVDFLLETLKENA